MCSNECLIQISESIKDSECIVVGDFSFEQSPSLKTDKRIVIVASYSNENDDLLCLVRRALSQGIPVVAITHSRNSKLVSWATYPITDGITMFIIHKNVEAEKILTVLGSA